MDEDTTFGFYILGAGILGILLGIIIYRYSDPRSVYIVLLLALGYLSMVIFHRSMKDTTQPTPKKEEEQEKRLSPQEAREWLDDFLVKQQEEKKEP